MHSICICTTYISKHILYYIHVFNLTTNDDDDDDVDYNLSPPPRSSVCIVCARTQVTFGPATPAPAPVDRPMDTG